MGRYGMDESRADLRTEIDIDRSEWLAECRLEEREAAAEARRDYLGEPVSGTREECPWIEAWKAKRAQEAGL